LISTRSLMLMAGRDLNVASTTADGSGQSGTGHYAATQLERLAGLYVTGDKGLLLAIAGRDLNLTAAEIRNTSGDTQLLAGRDLNLKTVTLGQEAEIHYSPGNTAVFGHHREIGTTIQGGGNIALAAGNDLNARAATVTAQGDLSLQAGHDLTITAGRATQDIDQASQWTSKRGGLFGKTKSESSAFQETRDETIGSTLAGRNVSLQAGRDLTLEAARLTAQDSLALGAGRDLTLASAETVDARNERRQVSTKEHIGPGRQSLKTTRDEITVTPDVTQLTGKDIALRSGRDMTLVAPHIQAETLSATAGGQLTVATATASHEREETSEAKSNRLNAREVTNPGVTGGRIKDKIRLGQGDGEHRAVVADIDAKSIALQSGGDTVLVAPRIRAETLSIEAGTIDGRRVNPDAKIELLGVKESTRTSSSKNSHSFVHETIRDGGTSQESLLLPDIQTNTTSQSTQLALAAPGGIAVGATSLAPTQRERQQPQAGSGKASPPAGTPYDLKAQAETLSQQPGLAWLGDLAKRPDVDWQKIELTQQSWDYKHAGLTREGAAVVRGTAVALNDDIAAKLNAIYGTDVSGAQKALLAIRITTALTGAAGTTKAKHAHEQQQEQPQLRS